MKKALIFWFTGLSGSGKTTVANQVKYLLEKEGYSVFVLDGDQVRTKLHRNLGFSEKDIKENNTLIAKLCQNYRKDYDLILVPIISPYKVSRDNARQLLGDGFFEVFFNASLDCVMNRDVKGLYTKAKNKEITNLIGYSETNPYEVPTSADFIVNSQDEPVNDSVRNFYSFVKSCFKKQKVVVISHQLQYKALIKKGHDLAQLKVICDNPRIHAFLKGKKVEFDALDEFLIPEEQRKQINAWGCDKAAAWIRISREQGLFKEMDLPSVLFLRFGYILVQMLKNFEYTRLIMDKYRPLEVIIFEFVNKPKYPVFSGNIFLNYFLDEFSKERKIKSEIIKVRFEKDALLRNFLNPYLVVKNVIKNILRKIVNSVYGGMLVPKKDVRFLVRGALKHLLPIIKEMRARGFKVALYDENFQYKSFKISKIYKIEYFISTSFKDKNLIDPKELLKYLKKEVSTSLKLLFSQSISLFKERDFAQNIEKLIFSGIEDYCFKAAEFVNHYENMFSVLNIKAILLDEDTTPKHALLAASARKKNIEVFSISHATMPVNFSVSENNKVFSLATTFVNSEFEKTMYAARGWDSAKIKVTGIPRFDYLINMYKNINPENKLPKEKINLFYCGASMKQYWPERGGYLGMHITNNGDAQRMALRAILDVIKNSPIEMVVKPHNFEGIAWQRFFQEEKPINKIKIESYTADFFKILLNCDAMILAHWSTALIEAALCRKPTILLDFYNSKNLAPYADFGFCKIVHNQEELKRAIENLVLDLKSGRQFSLKYNEEDFERVFGKRDVQSTIKVVNEIEKSLR